MTWDKGININNISEIRTATHTFFGVGAIQKIDFIAEQLVNRGVNSVIVMTGKRAYESTGAWSFIKKALEKNNINYVLYNKVQPNPETHQVDEAVAEAKKINATGVICVGGGSPIDAGKSVAILLKYPDKTCEDLYEFRFTPEDAAPVVAINLTHGTGSEANRFAVVTIPEKDFKPAIAYDCIYPLYSIDDPALMTGLPANQTCYVSVDAVNHVIEAATTLLNNPFAITLAEETIRIVATYLPKALADPKDVEARYFLTYAALLAGVSFDNGLLHFTHALEHPLSGLKPEITHGLGLAVLLPAVVKYSYDASAPIFASILSPIVPDLTGETGEAQKASDGVRAWLQSVGITQTLKDLGFKKEDLTTLVSLAFETPGLAGMIHSAATPEPDKYVAAIYEESF